MHCGVPVPSTMTTKSPTRREWIVRRGEVAHQGGCRAFDATDRKGGKLGGHVRVVSESHNHVISIKAARVPGIGLPEGLSLLGL